MTVKEAVDLEVKELWATGRVSAAARRAVVDAMLAALAARLAELAAEPEGATGAGESGG